MPRLTVPTLRNICAALVLSVTISEGARADSDPTAPPAEWTVTGSAAIASQYRFRGISESDNRPVLQVTITVTHETGFYVAAWASSAQRGNSPVDIGGSELDLYGGYTHSLGQSDLVVDGGVYGYVYAGMSNLNLYEFYGSLAETLGPVTAKIGAAFAPAQNVFDYTLSSTARDNLYVYGEVTGDIPHSPITLHSHLAHTGGGFDYATPYFDYSIGATAKWKRLSLDLSLVGTTVSHGDIARSGIADNASGGIDRMKLDAFYRQGKPVAVVSLTASF
jgi:uncharacterized protein (TIGR02001 family)